MKRILITQRLDKITGRDEYRDALDARWATLLWSWGLLPVPIASGVKNATEYLSELKPDGFLLSGGNNIGEAPDRDNLEYAVLDYAEERLLPVFGVCRGLQMINVRQGGRLSTVKGHVATRHLITEYLTGRERMVNSYHNAGVHQQDLGRELQVLATSSDGCVESLKHINLPWLAIMWHPEREKIADSLDKQLIINHLSKL